ncbi:cellulosome anchor protein [Gardnerella vaginalis]|uniref:CAP domain-containing protein n=1 Tax=Gardnerella vaginalis TaxID=2702 RepID=UPI000E21806F|nr:CAP domain-containing protein [Gardnerella vaginalis]RDW95592.1 cellulosome anchor protein [Gardnerella vaginalis]RDW95734.1 cellulosome anchor protein [Gardnerella vaginalis]
MKKQTPKSAEKMAFNSFSNNSFSSFSKKFTAATVAAILAGSAVSMFGATANTAFASDVAVSSYAHPATSLDSTSAKSTAGDLFRSVMNNQSLTQAQRDDAAKALEILYGRTEKPDWYDSKVKLNSGEESPDYITRLNNSISYMRAINEYRKSRGLNPLGVSLYTTAVAINDAFYSANVFDHARHYKTFENLAWGPYDSGIYDGGTTTDTMTGAMKLWVTDEKAKYDDFIAKGVSDKEIRSKHYLEVGHYLNFIHPTLTAMGLTSGNISNEYGTVISWEAVPASYLEGNKAPFTLDEYQKLINEYINGQHYDVTPSDVTPSGVTPAPAPVPSEETPSDVPGVEHDVTPSFDVTPSEDTPSDVTPSDFDFTPSFDVTPSEDTYTPSDFDFTPSFDVTPSEDVTPSDFDFTPSFDVTPSEDTPSDFDFTPSFDVTPSEDTPSDFDFTPSFDVTPSEDAYTPSDFDFTPSFDVTPSEDVTPSDFDFSPNFDVTPSEDVTPSDFDFTPSFDVTPSEDTETSSDFDFSPSFDEAPASDSDSNADSNVTPSDFTFDYNFDAVDARRFD